MEHQLDAQRLELIGEMHRLFAAQTWRLVAAMTAMMGVVVAALKI